jgi:hypothetical protein
MKIPPYNEKAIRAEIIASYVHTAGYKGVVCLSCGNATKALREALSGTKTRLIDISPSGILVPAEGKWFSPAEIHAIWPDYFDATSGHLPFWMMMEIGLVLRDSLGELNRLHSYEIPTGSGETIACLKMAYPEISFIAVYGHDKATEFNFEAPLNEYIKAHFTNTHYFKTPNLIKKAEKLIVGGR